MRFNLIIVTAILFCLTSRVAGDEKERNGAELLDGEFWRAQVLDDLMPLWHDHIRDAKHGAYYMNLSRDWRPTSPWDKVPAMISRQVFSFSAAYLLSGDEKYLSAAREGVDYLLEYGWDHEYGGWYNSLTQSGVPKDTNKTVSLQLYTNAGLALYYFTTGDERVRSRIEASLRIRQQHADDVQFDGYCYALNRDLSVRDCSKTKHAHYGYVGSLIHFYQATRDGEFLRWEERLMNLSAARMMDPTNGWIYGFQVKLDRQWQPIPARADDTVAIGAQLTAALAFLRLHQQSGEAKYRKYGEELGSLALQRGWNAERGEWIDQVTRQTPYEAVAEPRIHWWVQIYGAFLQLQLYHLTQDEQYLQQFQKMESYFERNFVDRKHGGIFASLSSEGEFLGDGVKASVWHTSYHEIEHGLLNYLYLNLYVNHKPAVLHFAFGGGQSARKHFVSLVDDPSIQIASVKVNRRDWTDFDARERSVTLPPGGDFQVEVTLKPNKRDGHSRRP